MFWINDIKILYENDNYLKFFPSKEYTLTDNLNAISRFAIYLFILLIVFHNNNDNYWLYVPVVLLILAIFINYADKQDPDRLYKEDELKKNREHFSLNNKELNDPNYDKDHDLYTGFYDSNGTLKINKPRKYGPIYYNRNELEEYQKAVCRKPTKDNPFVNPPITDLNTDNSPMPCNSNDIIDDQIIKETEGDDKFNADLYRNVSDLFNVKNGLRQFYTVPSPGVPNDQEGFANWCYKTEGTCKENQEQCLRYEDLRFKRLL